MDIVSEYIEPKPDEPKQPLRWMENCKPDKPGIWAWKPHGGSGSWGLAKLHTETDIYTAASGVYWCYIGPIPEILPPLKKVTERLWLEVTEYIEGEELCRSHWFDDATKPEHSEGDWYKTDRTREREC